MANNVTNGHIFFSEPPRVTMKGHHRSSFNSEVLQSLSESLRNAGRQPEAHILDNFLNLMRYSTYDRQTGVNHFVEKFIEEEKLSANDYTMSRDIYYGLIILAVSKINTNIAAAIFITAKRNQIFGDLSRIILSTMDDKATEEIGELYTFSQTRDEVFPESIIEMNAPFMEQVTKHMLEAY